MGDGWGFGVGGDFQAAQNAAHDERPHTTHISRVYIIYIEDWCSDVGLLYLHSYYPLNYSKTVVS